MYLLCAARRGWKWMSETIQTLDRRWFTSPGKPEKKRLFLKINWEDMSNIEQIQILMFTPSVPMWTRLACFSWQHWARLLWKTNYSISIKSFRCKCSIQFMINIQAEKTNILNHISQTICTILKHNFTKNIISMCKASMDELVASSE